MLQKIEDEILDFSGQSDLLPRYLIRDNQGNVVNDNVQIALKTPVLNEGTNLNKAFFENLQGDLYTSDRYNVIDESNTTLENSPEYWYTVREAQYSEPCVSLAYGKNIYVTSGSSGFLATSTNLTSSWTSRTSGVTGQLYVQFGNDKFVGVDSTGQCITSTNGTSWSSPISIGVSNVYGFRFVNKYFVALSNSGKIVYSSDGTTWTVVSASSNYSFRDIAYGDGVYIITGTNGTIMRSTNITSWSDKSATSEYSNTLESIAYGMGRFIAVCSSSTGRTSTDGGQTWTNLSTGTGGSIAFGNDTFLILSSASNGGVMYYSTDGTNFKYRSAREEKAVIYKGQSMLFKDGEWIGVCWGAKIVKSGYKATVNLDLPLTSIEENKILNLTYKQIGTITKIFEPKININGLGEIPTSPTEMDKDFIYSFIYKQNYWRSISGYMYDFKKLKTDLQTQMVSKVTTGTVSVSSSSKSVSLGYQPDLVICYYPTYHDYNRVAHDSGTNANYGAIPRVITNKTTTAGSISSSGFSITGYSSSSITLNYIALKLWR